MPLSRYVEEIHLGVVDDPHSDRSVILTEKVTVCPSCSCLHSLRHEDEQIFCVECLWNTPTGEPAQAA